MTNLYRIANIDIQITSMYESVHRYCKDYLVFGSSADLSLRTTQDDIDFERYKTAETDSYVNVPARQFRDDYLEVLAVYRKIAEALPDYNMFLMHGSCIAVDGKAYLFTAKSGTGKSTHTRLWRELLDNRAVMVNDDKPLIGISNNEAIAYGTPWDGKHRLSNNIAVPLKAVCILERAERNSIKRISFDEAYPMLMQQIYRPLNRDAMIKTLKLIDQLALSVTLWRLGCNMEPEAARVSYEAMKG